ncbi:MAG: CapA family protein, partial [Dehalococcoidia bacterium]
RLHGADITIGSLDAASSDRGTPIGCRETFSLLAPTAVTEGFARAGFDVITVASNHVKDCGASGPCGDATFLDTLAALRAVGVQPVGGGPTLAEARQPAVITVHGTRFAFLGYDDIASYYYAGPATAGTAPLDEAMLVEDIQAARAVADVVVVLPQWGEEYTPHPTERQRQLAATAVEAGATLVVGNHPHVVQAASPHRDSYVAYALGNFLFDQDWSLETTESVLLEATFRGSRLVAVRFVPLQVQEQVRPVFLDGEGAATVLRRMMEAAERLPE